MTQMTFIENIKIAKENFGNENSIKRQQQK